MMRWRPLLTGVLSIGFLCGNAASAQEAPFLHLTHPTPDGFTVFWESGAVTENPEIRIFTDEDGTAEVTGTLRREFFPRRVSSFRGRMERPDREAQIAFEESLRGRGLAAVRVSGAEPDTRYFVEVATAESAAYPAEPPLPGIRTAGAAGFVAESRQVIVLFPEASAGAVALLEAEGGAAPLFAVVGDELGDRYARFNLDHLVDPGTGETLQPEGTRSFTVHFFPGSGTHRTSGSSVEYTGTTRVAGAVSRDFVVDPDAGVAWFEFAPVAEQMAGQAFDVTITAHQPDGTLAESFAGTVDVQSDGDLEAGSSTAAFANGTLEGHTVVIGNTGDFRLTALDADSGAEGESNVFVVTTDWENWLARNVDPEDVEDSLREQRTSDPDGTSAPRLMRYAFDMDGDEMPPAEERLTEIDAEEYLSILFRRLRHAPDVRYLVEGGNNLDEWEVVDVIEPGSPEWVLGADTQPVGQTERRFLRIAVVGDRTYAFWQTGEYGVEALNDPEISDPASDPGDRGVTNLERYAFGMSGPDPELERLPSRRTVTDGGDEYQEVLFERLPAGEDVRYIVEATSDYPNWEILETFAPGEPTELVVRDTEPLPDTGYRIIRVRIEEVE